MRISRLVLAAVAAVVVTVPALAEDLTVVYKTTGGGQASTSTVYYSAEKMRTSGGNTDSIIEYGPGRIVTIDHKRKEYSEITMAEMEAAIAKMNAQMAALPPAMQKMMGDSTASVTVTKGAVRKVAGYDCQDYTLALGTSNAMHVCASTAVTPPVAKVDYRKYASLAGMGNSPMFKSFAKLADEMKKIQGFTLADSSSLKMMGQSIQSSREATEVKKGPIAAATFDVAAIAPGYKKVAHPLSKMK
jgi:hypothetical protein